jgi:hypothetical protein
MAADVPRERAGAHAGHQGAAAGQRAQPVVQRLVRAPSSRRVPWPPGTTSTSMAPTLSQVRSGSTRIPLAAKDRVQTCRDCDYLGLSVSHVARPVGENLPRTGEIKFLCPVEERNRNAHPRTVTRVTSGMLDPPRRPSYCYSPVT